MSTHKQVSMSPKSFLKARRPERFSDSFSKEVSELDRSLLEYHLSSITSRGQETDFERFARRLCEREVCPNLLPQTGPTGGGDSKVDSETFPVADSLSLAWFVGVGREAAKERWAFAFSAKAEWVSKVKSDVKKIFEVKRNYTKAFFVTNQAVPDRKRAKVEDDLREQYGLDVRILDRTWILDRVFSSGHEEIAVEELGVTALQHRELLKGPLDVKREKGLKDLEKRIRVAVQSSRLDSILVDDALEAAEISRNLELSRSEVEGRYRRADQMAQEFGSTRQRVESAYQWAWTLYWWFEDYEEFFRQYQIVEDRVQSSHNAYDFEQLTNLWVTVHGALVHKHIDPQKIPLADHYRVLVSELERLRQDKDRPSTALQADALLLKVQLTKKLFSGEKVNEELQSLKEVVLNARGLVGFPLEPFMESITQLNNVFTDSASYDELFETIVQVASDRDGELKAARLLLDRGERLLINNRPIDAIAMLGRTLGGLYKHESRNDVVHALYLCGCAYEQIGLPWAARGTLLNAASVATNDLWTYGDITPYQAACYKKLKWIELRIGRLPYIFAWHELDRIIRQALEAKGYDPKSLYNAENEFEFLIGRLLLNTDFFELKHLKKLPDILDALDLPVAADALLFALGHLERLVDTAKKVGEESEVFASKWKNIRSDIELSSKPFPYIQKKEILHSRVIGCHIIVESLIKSPCIEVAESLLATIESFLATSLSKNAVSREPKITITVRLSEFARFPFQTKVEEVGGVPHLVIDCGQFDLHALKPEQQIIVRDCVFDAAVSAVSQFAMFKDFEKDLEQLFRDEKVWERAVAFTSSFGTQSNVLGASPKNKLDNWFDEQTKKYPLLRTEPWVPVDACGEETPTEKSPGQGGECDDAHSPESLVLGPQSHEHLETVSLIRERLWGRAGWTGTAFMAYPGNEYPPGLALIFRGHDAGREIFAELQKELGKVDLKGKLRVTIVRGVDRRNPHAYKVVVGNNLPDFKNSSRLVAFVSRINKMEPNNSANLNRFIASYEAVGRFFIMPAYAPKDFDGSQMPTVDTDLAIGLEQIYIRDAWDIGLHDIDSTGIQADDDPIIPDGVTDAPVSGLIQQRFGK